MRKDDNGATLGGREVVVVGSGPNGLAAAIEMARHGGRVTVMEAAETVGGGTRTMELTLPGFRHDVCSAIHPLAYSSPCFRNLPLAQHGLEWITPPAALAHPFDDGTAAILERDIGATADTLDPVDREAYRQLMAPLVDSWEQLARDILGPIHLPWHPLTLARFGRHALRSAEDLAQRTFQGERARALFIGLAAHSFLPPQIRGTAAFGLILGILGHVNGWPIAAGGSGRISEALSAHLRGMGGTIRTGERVENVDQFSKESALLLDLTPYQVLQVAGHRLSARYNRRLEEYVYGAGAFKVDWALAGPIPWRAADCRRAATVHLGGTMAEISAAEREVWGGLHPTPPFVLVAQQSLFDPTRAPEGKHTGWAYTHTPWDSRLPLTDRIEEQVERFAPGFRELILERRVHGPKELQEYNENYYGGDINGGRQDLRQMVVRPVPGFEPYATTDPGIYLCSSSTPPGGGVHGMCGLHAARCALRHLARRG